MPGMSGLSVGRGENAKKAQDGTIEIGFQLHGLEHSDRGGTKVIVEVMPAARRYCRACPVVALLDSLLRYCAGGIWNSRLNARLNAASDS